MQQGGGLEMLVILAVFGLIFYFMIFRPQSTAEGKLSPTQIFDRL